jgi:ribonuclease-3
MNRFLEAIRRRFRGGGAVGSTTVHEVERLIGYRFAARERLIEALTHRSTLGDLKPGEERISYERLEFLGDSVLSLVTSDFLIRNFPEENEGQLTKKKSLLVSKGVLSKKADEIEALIGAIYVDGGFEKARSFIEDRILGDIDEFLEHRDHINFKSVLQEWVQSKYRSYPRYMVKSTTGPEHDKIFLIEVKVAGRPVGRGRGKSKKDAEQMAAKEALHALRKIH